MWKSPADADSTWRPASRCARCEEMARANVASAMPVTGTPRSSAFCTVQRPVPFCPASSSDDVHERLAGLGVLVREHLRGDLDQEALKVALVPLGEDLRDLRGLQVEARAQQRVRLADQLHVGVLDAVVHHLDEVTSAVGSHVGAARHAVDLGGDLLEDRAQRRVRLRGSAGHDRRAEQRALLAAGHAGAHKVDALVAELRLAAAGVRIVSVARVDDDVALVEQRHQRVDHGVRGGARLHHDHDLARLLERGHEVLERLGADEVALVAVVVEQGLHLLRAAVVHRDREAVAGKVPREIPAHHCESGHANLGKRHVTSLSIRGTATQPRRECRQGRTRVPRAWRTGPRDAPRHRLKP